MGSPNQYTFDAIVVGSGISGGWAAKELCEKGLKTLVLERGRNVEHIKDYPTAPLNPWDFEYRLNHTEKEKAAEPIPPTQTPPQPTRQTTPSCIPLLIDKYTEPA